MTDTDYSALVELLAGTVYLDGKRGIEHDAADAITALQADLAAERAKVQAYEEIHRWLLGEADDFPEEPPPLAGKYRRTYHWRIALRTRIAAALDTTKPKGDE